VRSNRHRLGSEYVRCGVLAAMTLLVLMGAAILTGTAGHVFSHAAATSSKTSIRPDARALAEIPMWFEPNQGQTGAQVKFISHGRGYGLFLTVDEAVLALQPSREHRDVVRMSLKGSNPSANVIGEDEMAGKSNYLIGNDPTKWQRNIPQFARVRYQDVYPGVDLVYYGSDGRLEYDLEVGQGSDPKAIGLHFEGADHLTLSHEGNLELEIGSGSVALEAPRAYQERQGKRVPVEARFVLRAGNEVGFELGAYDRSQKLVIDPVLSYSSFLGGSGNEACSTITGGAVASGCPAISVDPAFNVYVAGSTSSTDFPLTPTPTLPFQAALAGTANVFVTKFVPSASSTGPSYIIAFSTYLGGNGIDTSAGVAADAASNVAVAGTTTSTNFPTTANSFNPGPLGASANHVFVSELKSDGTALNYSTYLAGNGTEKATGLALDIRGKIYVSGTTTSTDAGTGFPSTANGFQLSSKSANQFFFTEVDPALLGASSIPFSSYLGGATATAGGVTMGGGIAVDTSTTPNVYITGGTDYSDLPFLNAFQAATPGIHAFLGKFTPSKAIGAQEVYLTLFGGAGTDVGNGVAVDSSSNAYITGSTTSASGFTPPTGITPVQAAYGGGAHDAFLAKFGTPCTGSTCTTNNVPLSYFTYLGGSGDEVGLAIAVDTIQGALITGTTDGTLPILGSAPQTAFGGGATDAFVARIDTTSNSTTVGHFSTFLGGALADAGTSLAVDTTGTPYVAGETLSSNFPVSSAPEQATLNGTSDAFVTKLGPTVNLTMAPTATPNPVGVGNQVTFKYTITNAGDLVSNAIFTDTLPSNATFVSATSTVTNACGTASSQTVTCNLGTLNPGATTPSVSIVVTPTAPTPPATAPTSLGNSATLTVNGLTTSASTSTSVNDFNISVAPATVTVPAGIAATYQVTVTPTGPFPDSVSLSCCSGTPANIGTVVFTTNPISNLTNGSAASSTVTIPTIMRPTTTTRVWQKGGPIYASWLSVSGLGLLGMSIGGTISRKRRVVMALLIGAVFALIGLQSACGSSSTTPTTVTGTPAGTYNLTLTATSGTASRTFPVTLIVQ
jgi:uncharacterized repeat protein (TIGR01451 family)